MSQSTIDKLDVQQAATELGCSQATVKRMSRRGELRPLHLGRKFWFLKSDIVRLIEARGPRQLAGAGSVAH